MLSTKFATRRRCSVDVFSHLKTLWCRSSSGARKLRLHRKSTIPVLTCWTRLTHSTSKKSSHFTDSLRNLLILSGSCFHSPIRSRRKFSIHSTISSCKLFCRVTTKFTASSITTGELSFIVQFFVLITLTFRIAASSSISSANPSSACTTTF